MKIGDSIILKEDYNVSITLGNVGFLIGAGSKGVILKIQDHTSKVLVGFKINETITTTAVIDHNTLKVI